MWGKSDLRGEKSRLSCRHVVVWIAILAISLNVATRTFNGFSFDHPSVQSNASQAMRQHLAADAVVLTNPVSDLGTMLLPVAAPHAPPDEVPIHALIFTESVYNRPPPSISLL